MSGGMMFLVLMVSLAYCLRKAAGYVKENPGQAMSWGSTLLGMLRRK